MRVLALDTTTRGGSAAVVSGDEVLAELPGDPSRSHAERLPGELLQILQTVSLDLSDMDLFAVAAGPGSFTGLRIGIATMQGLAFVTNRRIAAISALDALAHAAGGALPAGTIVGAWMDAHRHDVFSALYRAPDTAGVPDDRMEELEGPTVMDPASTLRRWESAGKMPSVIIGDGAVAYATLIGHTARVIEPPTLAGTIGRMAAACAAAGQTLDPAAVQPLYVRRPDAVLAREKQPGAAGRPGV